MTQAMLQALCAWSIACVISPALRPIAEGAPIWFNNAVPSKWDKESRIEHILLAASQQEAV